MIGPFREDWLAWGTVIAMFWIFAKGLYLVSLIFILLVCAAVLFYEWRKARGFRSASQKIEPKALSSFPEKEGNG